MAVGAERRFAWAVGARVRLDACLHRSAARQYRVRAHAAALSGPAWRVALRLSVSAHGARLWCFRWAFRVSARCSPEASIGWAIGRSALGGARARRSPGLAYFQDVLGSEPVLLLAG